MNTTTSPNEMSTDMASIASMFSRISSRYDLINRLMTFGLDQSWRRAGAKRLNLSGKGRHRILDLACGTGDFIVAVRQTYPTLDLQFDGVDVSPAMLEEAKVKMFEKHLTAACHFHAAAMEKLKWPDETFDGITIGFGIRNAADRQAALREMWRVLKPGGHLVILEALPPENRFFKTLQTLHMKLGVSFLGRFLSEGSAYKYLGRTVAAFPGPKDFCQVLADHGWQNVDYQQLCLQSVTLFQARK